MTNPMSYLTERDLNTIRGKVLVDAATREELVAVFEHLDELEIKLDEADDMDLLGTEGWRRWVGYPDE